MKPYAPSFEKNGEPILDQLRRLFADRHLILEIGSGTGQHAVYFAQHLTHLRWHASERAEALPGLQMWIDEAKLQNLAPPLVLELADPMTATAATTATIWPELPGLDGVFSANTAHIMPWPITQAMIRGVGQILGPGGIFVLYGAFNYNGHFTSASNERFDAWLKSQAPHQGVRDFEHVQACALAAGLILHEDIAMPSNNRLLCWHKAKV